jgi:hypothetical protein
MTQLWTGAKTFPRGEVFLTADQKLREAAVLSGFDWKQI